HPGLDRLPGLVDAADALGQARIERIGPDEIVVLWRGHLLDNVGNCLGSRKRSAIVPAKGPYNRGLWNMDHACWRDDCEATSPWQKCRVAGCRVGELLHRGAVEVFEPIAGEHGADGPFRDAFARPQEVGAVGGA